MNIRKKWQSPNWRHTALALALGMSLGTVAVAQSNNSGAIFGQVSSPAGSSVVIQNVDTGLTRTLSVDASGRYRASSLPTGNYKVTLQNNGTEISSRDHVVVNIAGSTEVSFNDAANARNLEGVSVIASALPSIDVSSVDTRTVLTAEQLSKIPVARNVSAAALLAPGVVSGDSRLGGLAIGGSGISENSYSINGYNITDPQTNESFFEMPFWAIDQQQVLTGGMGAEFGHSTGGVINIVGKRGGNTWKAGIATYWAPDSLRSERGNLYYPDHPDAQSLAIGPGPFGHTGPGITTPFPSNGKLRAYRNDNKNDQISNSAYISGPLIKDKLFLFAAADVTRTNTSGVGATATYNNDGSLASTSVNSKTGANTYWDKATKWYAKLDWNITDSHILELTGMADNDRDHTNYYQYNYETLTRGSYASGQDGNTKNNNQLYLGKYTGYITDDFTVSALYGKTKNKQPNLAQVADYAPVYTNAATPQFIRDVLHGYQGLLNGVPGDTSNSTSGWRIDLEYHLGDHNLRGGVDRQELKTTTSSALANEVEYGEGEGENGGRWLYTADPGYGTANGAIVSRTLLRSGGSYKEILKAYYLEDNWQVSERWLAYMGLRNESFENYNSFGKVFMKQSNQWAPRLGVSWDVNGDSSLKVYANLGRYFLALPNGVAVRGAGGSLFTTEDYSFTGIDPATDLPIGRVSLGPPTSSNAEYGQARDPRTARISDLKSHYQDEFIIGFDKQLTSEWTVGAKGILRRLESQVDDTGDPRPVCNYMAANNLLAGQYTDAEDCANNIPYPGVIFNPGKSADFYTAPYYADDGSVDINRLIHVHLSAADTGMVKPKRKYAQINAYLAHPFDGKWMGRLEYTWSHSYGNTEGQIKSDIAQTDVAASQDWDFPEFMHYANGNLPNDRRHQVRALGYYQLTPEWMLSAVVQANSGRPKNCLGPWFVDPDTGLYTDPDGYMGRADANGAFHVCYGKVSSRGKLGNLPWTYTLDLGVQYSPNFAANKLIIGANVFNVFDQQRPITISETSVGGAVNPASGGQPSNIYQATLQTSPGRYFRLSASYEFSL